MYVFNDYFMFEDVEVIVVFVYCEMLEIGFISVGEFYYLYYDCDGMFFLDLVEMFGCICCVV